MKVKVGHSLIHGKGVFATKDMPKGTYVGTYEGVLVRRNSRYVLWVDYTDGAVVGIRGTNDLRFLNHSRPGNVEFPNGSVKLYTIRHIKVGDELTFDYGEAWGT